MKQLTKKERKKRYLMFAENVANGKKNKWGLQDEALYPEVLLFGKGEVAPRIIKYMGFLFCAEMCNS